MKTAIAWRYKTKTSLAPKRGYASCESKKCLPKGRQRALHLLLKVSCIEEMLEAPRAGGPLRVGLCRDSAPVKAGLHMKAVFWLGSMFFMQISR